MLTGFHWEKTKVLCIPVTAQGMLNRTIRMLSQKKREKYSQFQQTSELLQLFRGDT